MIAYKIRVPDGRGVSIETTSDSALALLFMHKMFEQDADETAQMSVYSAQPNEEFTINSETDVAGIIETNY